MSEFRARISRVRMKSGGAVVQIIDRRPVNPEGEDWRGNLGAGVRKIIEQATEESPLVGYVLLGIYADGSASFGYRYDFDRSPIPRMMLPAWIAELIRRDLITNPEARDVFDEMFEWRDDA